MPLFGLGDITFGSSNTPDGPLRSLETSSFFGSTLRYPLDIGNKDKGHYMVFYIREQKNSNFKQNAGIADSAINQPQAPTSSAIGTAVNQITAARQTAINVAGDLGNKVTGAIDGAASSIGGSVGDALSGVSGAISSGVSQVQGLIGNIFAAPSGVSADAASTQQLLNNNLNTIKDKRFIITTQLTKDAIALYMPDTLLYAENQNYDNSDIGTTMAGQLTAAVEAGVNSTDVKSGSGAVTKSVALGALGTAAKNAGGFGKYAFIKGTGVVLNPMLELIYSSPNFREFQFDFTFYPRDEKEALEVQKIIEKFRFHQAPELVEGTMGFLIPPSEFDIRFYYGPSQNPNIPPIATCVLTGIQLNYAPNGFNAYEIPGQFNPSLGGTGMPVAIQMTLNFKEVTYLTKSDYRNETASGSSGSLTGLINDGGMMI